MSPDCLSVSFRESNLRSFVRHGKPVSCAALSLGPIVFRARTERGGAARPVSVNPLKAQAAGRTSMPLPRALGLWLTVLIAIVFCLILFICFTSHSVHHDHIFGQHYA